MTSSQAILRNKNKEKGNSFDNICFKNSKSDHEEREDTLVEALVDSICVVDMVEAMEVMEDMEGEDTGANLKFCTHCST